MKKYTSKYKELSFYSGGERKKFINGVFETKDKEDQKVLDNTKDAIEGGDVPYAAPKKVVDPTIANDDFTQSGPVTEDVPGGSFKQSGPVTEDEAGGTFEQSGPVTVANTADPKVETKADDAKPVEAKAPAKK